MNRLVWGGLASVVVGTYVGGAVYARSQVPAVYDAISLEAAKKFPMAQLSHKIVSRGLFSSKVEVTVTLGCGPDAKPAFKYQDTLTHGPILWSHGFGKMFIQSELLWDGEAKAAIAKAFGKNNPFDIGTKIAFDGTATVTISSPATSFTDHEKHAVVKWGGLQSAFSVVDAQKVQIGQLTFDMPELTVTQQADNAHFSILGTKASMKENGQAGGMALGAGGFSVKTISMEHPAKQIKFIAQDLRIDAASTANGAFMEFSESFGVKSMQVNARDYGPLSLKLLLKHLHIPSLLALQQDMESAQAQMCKDPQASQAGVMAAVQKHGTAVLANAPIFVLESLKAKFPEGDVSLSATASIPGFTAADAEQGIAALTGAAMQKLKAEAHLTAAEAVVKYFAQLSPVAGSYDQTSAAALESGLLLRKGTDLTMDAQWENGAARINGQSQAEVMQKMQAAMAPGATSAAVAAPED